MTNRPYERPVDALCLCPANRFVAPTPGRVHWSTMFVGLDGPLLGPVKTLGSETAQEERRSIFSRRPISTARVIALRVVDLLVFESRASIARVATHLPPPSAIALNIACKTRCSARLNTPRQMAVDRFTGCSAIIVPRRIALATRTQCLSMPVPFLGLRANILFLSTMVGIVPTEPSRRGTGPLNRALLHRKSAQ